MTGHRFVSYSLKTQIYIRSIGNALNWWQNILQSRFRNIDPQYICSIIWTLRIFNKTIHSTFKHKQCWYTHIYIIYSCSPMSNRHQVNFQQNYSKKKLFAAWRNKNKKNVYHLTIFSKIKSIALFLSIEVLFWRTSEWLSSSFHFDSYK